MSQSTLYIRSPSVLNNYSTTEINDLTIKLPSILLDLFNFVNSNFTEGIFRINGSIKRINYYYNDLSSYKEWLGNSHIHDICGLIKRILNKYFNTKFSDEVIENIKQLFLNYLDEIEDDKNFSDGASISSLTSSNLSFKTASTSFANNHLVNLLKEISCLIATKSSRSKNHLFIYLLNSLNHLLAYKNVTKMSSLNFSIIFQPFLLNNSNLTDLKIFQKLLRLLILNSELFTIEFSIACNELEIDMDDSSVSTFNSIESLTIDDFNMSDGVNSKNNNNSSTSISDKSSRRKSISSRFSTLLDNYYNPVGKTKRFSLDFSRSKENLLRSKESLVKSKESLGNVSNSLSLSSEGSIENFNSHSKSNFVATPDIDKKKKSHRKSFISLFKNFSHESANANPIYNHLNYSTDHLVVNKRKSLINDKNKSMVKRNFSLKLKSKKY